MLTLATFLLRSNAMLARWLRWQEEVVNEVRREFRELFHSVHLDDFDWEAWRPLFDAGYAPQSAVREALSDYSHHPYRRRPTQMHLDVD